MSSVPPARAADPSQSPGPPGLSGARPGVVGVVRRRPGWVWGGASLIVVSAVGFAAVMAAAGERQAVLAVVADVPAGHVIEAGDVREVQVAADAGVVLADQAGSVVGQVAAVPLAAGSLLAPGQIAEAAVYPPKGHSEVSFAVAAGDMPPLERGQRVAVFDSAADSSPVASGEDGVMPVVGTVTGLAEGESSGSPVVVTMVVESVAAQRAAGVERPRMVLLAAADESEAAR